MRTSPIVTLSVVLTLFAGIACQKRQEESSPEANAKQAESHAAPSAEPPSERPETQPGAAADIPAPPDVAAPPKDAESTPSGLRSKVLEKGAGNEHPEPQDRVRVHYSGWTPDGKMFDSSVKRGAPATFGVAQVIKGWTEGLQLMTEGESRRFWIPAELAYGKNPRPGAPAGDLVFDVKLLEILKAPKPPEVPKDVAAAPPGAKRTASGLAYTVLAPGKGKVHPSESSRVTVHYTGWTTDGKMFDSSVVRDRPSSFYLKGVIPGWTEGLQLMTEGAKYRFWIPGKLAYGDEPKRPGAPAGTLVFDVELLEID